MMGGPLGKMLIERHHLLDTIVPEDDSLLVEEEIKHERHSSMYPAASFQLIIAMGIGTVLSKLLSLTGMTFPIYIGAMIAAACIRNLGEYGGKFTVYMGEINDIGGICLSLFLGMAMITLKIWALAELALPLVVLLAGQTLFMTCILCDRVQRHGPRLRRGRHRFRHLRLRHGCHPQRHGQHAGRVRQVFPFRQGLSAHPAGGQSVRGFHQQPCHYGIHQLYLILS